MLCCEHTVKFIETLLVWEDPWIQRVIRRHVRTWRLAVQPENLLVSEVLSLLTTPLLALSVFHFGAAETDNLHRGHTHHFVHFHLYPSRHSVPAAVKSLARVREDDVKGLHSLCHRYHGADSRCLRENLTKDTWQSSCKEEKFLNADSVAILFALL